MLFYNAYFEVFLLIIRFEIETEETRSEAARKICQKYLCSNEDDLPNNKSNSKSDECVVPQEENSFNEKYSTYNFVLDVLNADIVSQCLDNIKSECYTL